MREDGEGKKGEKGMKYGERESRGERGRKEGERGRVEEERGRRAGDRNRKKEGERENVGRKGGNRERGRKEGGAREVRGREGEERGLVTILLVSALKADSHERKTQGSKPCPHTSISKCFQALLDD